MQFIPTLLERRDVSSVDQERSSNELDICVHPVKERNFISQIKYLTATTLIYKRVSYELEKFYLSNYPVMCITGFFMFC